ncbi:Rgg/GadR/MutR family transcriptional activator [Streptococcus rupicaprae]|uniref:Rgg/GadR/MutR family transcriptional activator n=1 Tax=Streptococcus rupicaprae TaxID=759619 RepID=A0ABV2FIS9_9STRE
MLPNYGQIFKEFRINRHFTLKQVANEHVSLAQLSKFERGETDLSLTKFISALDAINVRVTEFMDRVNNYQRIQQAETMNKMLSYFYRGDIDGLNNLIAIEKEKSEKNLTTYRHRLNAIMFKGAIAQLENHHQMESSDLEFVSDYLFSVENWGVDEVLLVINLASFYPTELVVMRTRKIIENKTFYQELPKNQKLVEEVLIDTVLLCLSRKELKYVPEFIDHLSSMLEGENSAYRRIIFHYIKGFYNYLKGDNSGLALIEEAIAMLETLNYPLRAKYYREFFKRNQS